jgi:hypothetical protein
MICQRLNYGTQTFWTADKALLPEPPTSARMFMFATSERNSVFEFTFICEAHIGEQSVKVYLDRKQHFQSI